MSVSLYKLLKKETTNRGVIANDKFFNMAVCSIGCHILNLNNLDKALHYESGKLQNFRTPIIFVAPSGFGKTTIMEQFCHPKYGLLKGSTIPVTTATSISDVGFTGTIHEDGETTGIFDSYKRGVFAAHDWQRLVDLISGDGRTQMEEHLLSGLDEDVVSKYLASGVKVIDKLGITLWAGMRYPEGGIIKTDSGLMRRFAVVNYYPTIDDINAYTKKKFHRRWDYNTPDDVYEKIGSIVDEMIVSDELINLYDEDDNNVFLEMMEAWYEHISDILTIPHFYIDQITRLILGWSVVNNYKTPQIDNTIEQLIVDIIRDRNILSTGALEQAVLRLLGSYGEDGVKERVFRDVVCSHFQINQKGYKTLWTQIQLNGSDGFKKEKPIIVKKEGKHKILYIRR